MDFVYLVMAGALLEYAFMILLVGGTRQKFGVEPPSTAGHPLWEKYHRVQVNTTEQLVLFLPALFAFATYVSPLWAARLGTIFLIGRVIYFVSYARNPRTRLPGAVMSSFTSYFLVLGTLIALIRKIFGL